MLLAWVTNAFFDSFTGDAPWDEAGMTGEDAIDYFYNEIIGMGTITEDNEDLRPTRVVGANVGYNAVVGFVFGSALPLGPNGRARLLTSPWDCPLSSCSSSSSRPFFLRVPAMVSKNTLASGKWMFSVINPMFGRRPSRRSSFLLV